jgi:phosphoglycolate phosphatase-like HAD superfamily hydrolase
MKGTVIFDFDDTLADTVSFKVALARTTRPDEVVARMSDFIFPLANDILGILAQDGWKLALVTFGDPTWQRRKLMSSGLLHFFDYVLFTAEPKVTQTAEFLKWPAPLVFVNDHGGELDALKKILPEAKLIAVRGPKAASVDPNVPLCGSLQEVYKNLAMM